MLMQNGISIFIFGLLFFEDAACDALEDRAGLRNYRLHRACRIVDAVNEIGIISAFGVEAELVSVDRDPAVFAVVRCRILCRSRKDCGLHEFHP